MFRKFVVYGDIFFKQAANLRSGSFIGVGHADIINTLLVKKRPKIVHSFTPRAKIIKNAKNPREKTPRGSSCVKGA